MFSSAEISGFVRGSITRSPSEAGAGDENGAVGCGNGTDVGAVGLGAIGVGLRGSSLRVVLEGVGATGGTGGGAGAAGVITSVGGVGIAGAGATGLATGEMLGSTGTA